MAREMDPVLVARARLGNAARGAIPGLSVEQARKDLALAKLRRHIEEVTEEHDLDSEEIAALCGLVSG